jgi:hypothetical protein
MRYVVLVTLLATAPVAALAQTESPFYGQWAVTWEGKKQVYEARLVVGAQGGTWKTSAREKNNPCVGRDVPVKIASISPQEATLTLAFSEALSGCKDSTVVLKLDGTAVTGTREANALTLKRE